MNRMRKLMSIIMVAVMLLSVMPMTATAIYYTETDEPQGEYAESEYDPISTEEDGEEQYHEPEIGENENQADYSPDESPDEEYTDADTDESIDNDLQMELEPESIEQDEYEENIDFLTGTLGPSMGMQGFEGPYELPSNQEEMIDIIVQFRTLPSVAQRLSAEAEASTRMGAFSDEAFEPDALLAHERFAEQLAQLIMPASLTTASIIGSHHTLFNGVYMNVAAGMVGIIAELPEVFLVTPAPVYYPMMELEQMQQSSISNAVRFAPESPMPASNPNRDEPFFVGGYQTHPEFNLGAREMFNIHYIHNNMRLTGKGIRVGIIDTGVDYRHPIFWNSLVDAELEGRESLWTMDAPGHPLDGRPVTLRGGNAMAEPQSGAYARRGQAQNGRTASPMEMGHLRNIPGSGQAQTGFPTIHGTHVAGTVLAMAPDATIYAFRCLNAAPGGSQPANSVMASIEWAYDLGLDAVNLSLGSRVNTPWQAVSYALNLANLAGMVTISSAGNDGIGGNPRAQGRGGWFSLGGGAPGSSLGITVGSGVRGGRDVLGMVGAHVNNVPAPTIGLAGHAPGFSYSQWNHSAQNVPFTWFGRLTLPNFNAGIIPALATQVRNNLLGGSDLTGRVMVWNRGGGEFPTARALAIELNAIALIVINNQADNTLLSGTVLNHTIPENAVPIFSIGMLDANTLFGFIPATGNETDPGVQGAPRGTGVLNFGSTLGFISPPDTISPFSSVGPMGPLGADATMHIFPDILAPGSRIVSANAINDPDTIDGRPYIILSGTSMASPAITGLVALMLQNIDPNRENLDTRSTEVKGRLMSTARPLTGYDGEYSVLQVGAGVARPIEALRTPAFATTVHRVPHPQGSRWIGDGVGGFPNLPNTWQLMTMTSMSFGRLQLNQNEGFVSDPMRVTIRGAGSWSFARHEPIMPTQQLLPIDQPNLWGPPLQHTTAINVTPTNVGANVFDFTLSHDGNYANRGFAQGRLVFTNGTSEIFIIYGAYFDIYSPGPGITPGFEYRIIGSGATVTGFRGFIPQNLVIPETLGGFPVTAIGSMAFLSETSIRSVVMPDTVVSINANAFTGATNLEHVTLSNRLQTIGAAAFSNNISLTQITLPSTLRRIEGTAFRNTSLESINLPDGLEFIGASAFRDTRFLQSIVIPRSVTSIGASAFEDALSLLTVRVYASGTIGVDAFRDNPQMTSLYLADSVTSIGARIALNSERLTDVRLSGSLATIPSEAFRNNPSLVNINIPHSVTSIAANAFADNPALNSVFIPPSVTSITASAFSNSRSTTIHGLAGSFAQTFANQQGITFVAVNAPITSLAFSDAPMFETARNQSFFLPLEITPSSHTDTLSFSASGTGITVNATTGLVRVTGFGSGVITVTNGTRTASITINVREHNFPITFNPNGGTWGGALGTQSQVRNVSRGLATDTYAQSFNASDNLVNPALARPTREGHTFGGWFNTSAQTGGTRLTSGMQVQLTGTAQTLWARWVPIPPQPTFGISVTPGNHTFAERTLPNYIAPQAATWTVRNTGNQATGALTVANSNTAAFTISTTSLASIPAGTATRTFTVTPRAGLAAGTHTATITVSGANIESQSFNVTFRVNPPPPAPPTFGISVTPGNHTFPARALPNYTAPQAATWTVRNTGNQPTGALTVTNSNTAAFTISTASLASIPAEMATRTFTVTPRAGLAAGTHRATITVRGGASITAQSFTVTFVVNPAPQAPAQRGWARDGANWTYILPNGSRAVGWRHIGNIWYHFTNAGIMQTGWRHIGNVWYFFNAGGAMQTGWQNIGNIWYFFNAGGAMQTGWQHIGNVWYFFNAGGAMQTGWQSIGNVWYFFCASGAMQTGWQLIGNVWYFFDSGGAMVTGWQLIGGTWHYFTSDGAMVTGQHQIGSAWHLFSSGGVWLG